jgi:hypothetical protein
VVLHTSIYQCDIVLQFIILSIMFSWKAWIRSIYQGINSICQGESSPPIYWNSGTLVQTGFTCLHTQNQDYPTIIPPDRRKAIIFRFFIMNLKPGKLITSKSSVIQKRLSLANVLHKSNSNHNTQSTHQMKHLMKLNKNTYHF